MPKNFNVIVKYSNTTGTENAGLSPEIQENIVNLLLTLKPYLIGAGIGAGSAGLLNFLSFLRRSILDSNIKNKIKKYQASFISDIDLDISPELIKKKEEKTANSTMTKTAFFDSLLPNKNAVIIPATAIFSFYLINRILREFLLENQLELDAKDKLQKAKNKYNRVIERMWENAVPSNGKNKKSDLTKEASILTSLGSIRDLYWGALAGLLTLGFFESLTAANKKVSEKAIEKALKRQTLSHSSKYPPEIYVDLPDRDDKK